MPGGGGGAVLSSFMRSGFIVFSMRIIGFHRQVKLLELNFFGRKLSTRWSNQAGKISLFSQPVSLPVLTETPACVIYFICCRWELVIFHDYLNK